MDAGLIALATTILSALGLTISGLAFRLYRQSETERLEQKRKADQRGELLLWYAMSDQTKEDRAEFRRRVITIFGQDAPGVGNLGGFGS